MKCPNTLGADEELQSGFRGQAALVTAIKCPTSLTCIALIVDR